MSEKIEVGDTVCLAGDTDKEYRIVRARAPDGGFFISMDYLGDTQPGEIRWFRSELQLLKKGDKPEPKAYTHTLPVDSAARKEFPIYDGVFRYFPAALALTAYVSKHGNNKHNPGTAMHHDRTKSGDHANCIGRHLMDLEADYGKGVGYDEHGIPQVGYIVWRAMALAQEWLEKHEGKPVAPGATF